LLEATTRVTHHLREVQRRQSGHRVEALELRARGHDRRGIAIAAAIPSRHRLELGVPVAAGIPPLRKRATEQIGRRDGADELAVAGPQAHPAQPPVPHVQGLGRQKQDGGVANLTGAFAAEGDDVAAVEVQDTDGDVERRHHGPALPAEPLAVHDLGVAGGDGIGPRRQLDDGGGRRGSTAGDQQGESDGERPGGRHGRKCNRRLSS
jgi:hypothetical protein